MVSDIKVPHVSNLYPFKNTRRFTEDLDYLLKYFNPIGLGDLISAAKKEGGFTRRCFHLTFDDGFRELHDIVAPILINKGIPATFFVNSAFIDNKSLCYQHKASVLADRVKDNISEVTLRSLKELMKLNAMDSTDMPSAILSIMYHKREMLDKLAECMGIDLEDYLKNRKPYLDSSQIHYLIGKGFTVGSHSIDHPMYSNIGFDEKVRQTVESTRWVREKYKLDYGAFAFPHTDRNVERRFFLEILATGLVDISFGTGGMINEHLSMHLQRFSMEKPVLPAERIIAMQYARKALKRGS